MRTLILAGLLLAPAAWAAGMYDGTYHGQLTADGSNATNCVKSAPIQMTVTNDQLEYHHFNSAVIHTAVAPDGKFSATRAEFLHGGPQRPTDPDRYRPDHRRWHRGQGVAQQFLQLRDGAEEVPVTIRWETGRGGRVNLVASSPPIPRQRTSRNRGGFGIRFTARNGSGFQPAMVRAHSCACALSVMPGNRRRSSTAAELATLLIDGADRSGISLGDNEHAGAWGGEWPPASPAPRDAGSQFGPHGAVTSACRGLRAMVPASRCGACCGSNP